VRDIAKSRAFYERALQPFGVRVVQSSQGPGFATDDDRGDFWIQEQETAGVDNGGPGLRPHYHSAYYAAFVLDPDGNNVEAVFHGDSYE
jgi:catechol 2,3-dioxygenase-like lactoylglutathione lyase family enzyme